MLVFEKIGTFVEEKDIRNASRNHNVLGLNKNKEFMPTAINMDGVDLAKYKVIQNGDFVYSGMQTGRDICIRLGFYQNEEKAVVSPAYTTFRLRDTKRILPEYFFMYFYRKEMDRLGWFLSDASIRSNLDWERLLNICIPVPSIEIQRSMVSAWKGVRDMQRQNEQMAEPLMSLCRSYLQDLKHKYPAVEIRKYIELWDKVNLEGKQLPVIGINKAKEFMSTVANIDSVDLRKYKIISSGCFVFSGMQTGRDVCIRLGLYTEKNEALMSPAYTTFIINSPNVVCPEYLFMYFTRGEMDRLGWFYSDSSIRSNLEWERFLEIKIPLPPLEVQRGIVNVFTAAQESKRIASEACRLSREICPLLIQKAIHQ